MCIKKNLELIINGEYLEKINYKSIDISGIAFNTK